MKNVTILKLKKFGEFVGVSQDGYMYIMEDSVYIVGGSEGVKKVS